VTFSRLMFNVQVVPDGFGVAYMTGYEGKGLLIGIPSTILNKAQIDCNTPSLPARRCRTHNLFRRSPKQLKICTTCTRGLS